MAFYLSSKKLDVRGGEGKVIINENDALENGIVIGDRLSLEFTGQLKNEIVSVDLSDTLVDEGEIGFYEDFFDSTNITEGSIVKLEIQAQSHAVEFIRKKLTGKELSYEEIYSIIADIANDKLDKILIAYFVSAGYAPGFNKQEMFYMTKALAETGQVLKFRGIVADKHSIGGIAGKGITPLIIPILATFKDIMLPNTSSRAVTSASATTDMLEVIMPMSFSKETLESMLFKNNAVMVWGGGVDLAPADDKIIQIQKPLGIESIDKFVSSIISKKIAQGVTHVIFDVPVGKGAKIETEKEFEEVKSAFEEIAPKFGIKVYIHRRNMNSIDGWAVGPSLECREFLRIYERHAKRSIQLENDALQMAGKLIELCGKAEKGMGYKKAKDILESGKAFEELKKILSLQGGNPDISSNSLEIGGITFDIKSPKTGKIINMNNKNIFQVCKALGNPRIKEAGLYFYKKSGDSVESGEKLATVYATSESRMALAKGVLQNLEIFEFE